MDIRIEQVQREDFAAMIELADLTLPDRMNVHELKKYIELFPELLVKATHEGRLIGFCCAGLDALRRIPTVQEVLVTVNEQNRPSIRALESFGFQFSRREHDYYGPGKHRDILELPLQPVALAERAEHKESLHVMM